MIAKLILIGLPLVGLGINIAKHGEDKDAKFNGWSFLLYISLQYILFYHAGIFN